MHAAALTEDLHPSRLATPFSPSARPAGGEATGPREADLDDAAPFPLWLVPFAIVLAPVVLLVVAVFPAFVSARELADAVGSPAVREGARR